MAAITIGTSGEYITKGLAWSDGSGNVDLCANIVFNANDLTGNYFNGFDASFNFGNKSITITGGILSKPLITDLSNGTLYDLSLVIQDFSFNQPFVGGVLTGTDGRYGNVRNITVDASNININNDGNVKSLLLGKGFCNNATTPFLIENVTFNGTNVYDVFSNSSSTYGMLFNQSFKSYSGTVPSTVKNITNYINYDMQNSSLLGERFGEQNNGTIDISNCKNYGNIYNLNSAGIVGNQAGYQQNSTGIITIRGCDNSGIMFGDESAGIVGKQANYQADTSGTLNVFNCNNYREISGSSAGIIGNYLNQDSSGVVDISNCKNYGNINNDFSAGIVGFLAGYLQNKDGNITIRGCDNSGTIIGQYSAGIVGKQVNQEADASGTLNVVNCNNYGNINNSDSAGIVGNYLNQDSSGVVDISNCKNYGNINNSNSAGIVGNQAGYLQNKDGNITIRGCDNSGIIFGENSAGIVGKQANYQADTSGTLNVFNCNNYGDISGSNSAGIVGINLNQDSSGVVDISNCKNYGNIKTDGSVGIAGYRAGYLQKKDGIIIIRGCDNSGIIVGNNSAGIVGFQANQEADASGTLKVINCNNYRDISGSDSAGIVGNYLNLDSSGTVDISNCKNYGNINNDFSAGIVGYLAGTIQHKDGIIIIRGCDNSGIIFGDDSAGIIGYNANQEADASGTLKVFNCNNYGNIYGPSSAGILGKFANTDSNGEVIVSHCVNYGGLFGKDASFNDFITSDYPYFNNTSYYAASSGIVGPKCGNGMASSGSILIENCDNSGSFNAPYTSGITSFGMGINSSGTIDISGCTNYAKLQYTGCAGISAGLIGINNTGIITFNNCVNYGDISGVGGNKIETGCLIHSIGYVNLLGNETSGEINIINCVNDNSCYNERDVVIGGIIGVIYLSATKQINIDISNCENTINNVIVPSNCYTGGICLAIEDSYVGSTANNTISINNCIANPLTQVVGSNVVDCKIIFTLASKSFCNTPCTLNIYENTIDCGDIITSTLYISILCFIDDAAQNGLLNKNINIYSNNITVNDISNAPVASMILSVKALENCAIDICNNTVSINSITGSSLSVSGILSEDVEYLKNVDMLIRNNIIQINTIGPNAINVAGLIRVITNNSFFDTLIGTFSNCDNFNLTITGNEISSNTLDVLIDGTKGNAGLIGTNTDIDPTGSTYRGPIGTLIFGDNAIDNIVYGDDYTDYYFQPNFRPYIFALPEYPGSNYWFNDGTVYVPRPIGSETNDVALRQIFKRAIKAINEQTRFEIYPFYHIKVKAKKM
jgi:hypothetical protein